VRYVKQRTVVAGWRVTRYDWFYTNKLRRTQKRLAFVAEILYYSLKINLLVQMVLGERYEQELIVRSGARGAVQWDIINKP